MFLRRILKNCQISSSVGTMRTISTSLKPTPSSPALKRKMFANLKSSEKPCDDLLRDMEKQGLQITHADLIRWADLMDKQGHEKKYFEIHSFMEWKGRLMVNKSLLRPAAAAAARQSSQSEESVFIRKNTFSRLAKTIAPFLVHLHVPLDCYGSGILFGKEGKIITCGHVVLNVDKFRKSPVYRSKRIEVKITLKSGETFRGIVADCDPGYDLALVKIEAPEASLSPARFGVSKDAAVGDMVLSIGNPLQFADSLSAGIISCVNRSNKEIGAKGSCQVFLQTDCALNEGNSGGPVVNLDGEVIGVNCLFGDEKVGVGFAIPIDSVLRIMKERKW